MLPSVTYIRKQFVPRENASFVTLSYMDKRDDWRRLEGTWDRLKWARLVHAGISTGEEAARRVGVRAGTYRAYERSPDSSKHIPLDHRHAGQIATKLKVRWEWLLTGEGEPWQDDKSPKARIARGLDKATRPSKRPWPISLRRWSGLAPMVSPC